MRDLIILGGGPAGYLAAERAGAAGMDVLLIEERALGGVCLNEGCIPSKTLLYSAKLYDGAKRGEKYGVHTQDITLNHSEVVMRKNRVVTTLVGGIKAALASHKVTVVHGRGVITGRDAEGFHVTVNSETHTSKRLLIATGSSPALPPIPGLREGLADGHVLTNREILDLPAVPNNLVIVGGGVIGLEMAGYYATAGAKVTVVEMLDSIGGPIDADIAVILQKNLAAKGIQFELNAKVVSMSGQAVVFERNGETKTIPADKTLVAIGRRPVTAGIGLETISLTPNPTRGNAIQTDRFMQTGQPGVYAAGDVTGEMMLAHVAYRQAEVAVAHMQGKRDPMRYDVVPSVIYTTPEVGAVGETEKSARDKGLDFNTVKLPMRYSGRYLAENQQGDGICKLLTDRRTGRILGCHMIGSYASEIILAAGVMMETCVTVDRAKTMIFPHPTVGEMLREVLFQIK